MRKVEFVPLLLHEKADIFTYKINDNSLTEFHKFYTLFNTNNDKYIKNDWHQILATLQKMSETGINESFFRNEGKISDRICALPLLTLPRNKNKHGTLRLYCLRISNKLLIVGGGNIKKTKTYQEDNDLTEHVNTLQLIDKELSLLSVDSGKIETLIYNLTINIR